MEFDVFGIENPLIDLLVQVPEDFFKQVGVEKNAMYLVDMDRHKELLQALGEHKVHPELGGSCANTLLGIAQLGGKTAFLGKVGGDDYGQVYIKKLEEAGMTSFIKADGSLTGSTVILIAPDAARTMNTFLGACQELHAEDVPLEAITSSKKLYLTGYLWDTTEQQGAATRALVTAEKAGIPVAMSLSDAFCVNRHRADFINILQSYVTTVFANREEALAITGADTAHEAMGILREWCPRVAITLGSSGALVADEHEMVYIDPEPIHAVDSTGAGDAFAAGYLYGVINGASLFQCGRLGSYFAAKVVSKVGPRLEGDVRKILAPILDDPR